MGYLYVGITITLTIIGQLVVKWRLSLKGELPQAIPDKIIFLLGNLLDPFIIAAMCGTFIAGLSWMAALSKMDLSHAYPFISITFPAIVILSGVFFHEPLSAYKIIGISLIIAGVLITSRG